MKFDLTKNVSLEPAWQKRYRQLRCALYILFVIASLYFAYHILLPSENFSLNPKSALDKNNNLQYDGSINNASLFSAYSRENFSTINLQLVLSKQAPSIQAEKILIRKTYKAFTYPMAMQPVGFPTGNSENGAFANGAILSFDNSVFVVADGKVMPFNNPLTFLSFGYQWSDVIPASEAEIGLYQRDKLFTINHPHPDGTIFLTQDSKKYFLIQNEQKLEIKDAEILKTYLKGSPIAIAEKSLDFELNCELKKNLWPLNSYGCSIPIEKLAQFTGNDYQFTIGSINKENIRQINLTFSRSINWNNVRDALSDIKHKILINYGLESAN